MTVHVARAEFSQKEKRAIKRKLKEKWKLDCEPQGYKMMKENDKLIKVSQEEFEQICEWGNQFILMAKRKFISMDQVKIQKSQQLIDGLTNPKTTREMERVATTYNGQMETRKKINNNIIHKDHPEMTVEDQIGEAYGGE